MSSAHRLANGVLAVAGSMLAHSLAYVFASTGSGVSGHGATEAVLTAAASALLGVLAFAVVRSAVTRGTLVSFGVAGLTAAQTALFGAQELVEGVGSGHALGSTVTAPTFLIGVAVQPVVAIVLVWLVRRAARVGTAGATATPGVRRRDSTVVWSPPSLPGFVGSDWRGGRVSRGPPC